MNSKVLRAALHEMSLSEIVKISVKVVLPVLCFSVVAQLWGLLRLQNIKELQKRGKNEKCRFSITLLEVQLMMWN